MDMIILDCMPINGELLKQMGFTHPITYDEMRDAVNTSPFVTKDFLLKGLHAQRDGIRGSLRPRLVKARASGLLDVTNDQIYLTDWISEPD
jgi:hypothetical protein